MIKKVYLRERAYRLSSILMIMLIIVSCAKKEPNVEWKEVYVDNILRIQIPVNMVLERTFIKKLDGHNLYSSEYGCKNDSLGFYYEYGEHFRSDMFDVFTNKEPKYKKTTKLINGRNAVIFSYQGNNSNSFINRAFNLPFDNESNPVSLILYFPVAKENKTAIALYFFGKGDRDFKLASRMVRSIIFQ